MVINFFTTKTNCIANNCLNHHNKNKPIHSINIGVNDYPKRIKYSEENPIFFTFPGLVRQHCKTGVLCQFIVGSYITWIMYTVHSQNTECFLVYVHTQIGYQMHIQVTWLVAISQGCFTITDIMHIYNTAMNSANTGKENHGGSIRLLYSFQEWGCVTCISFPVTYLVLHVNAYSIA